MKNKSIMIMLFILSIVFLFCFVALNGLKIGELNIPTLKDSMHLGLDLKGGIYILLEVETKKTGKELNELMTEIKSIITKRVDSTGLSEPIIVIEDGNHLRIELAGISSTNDAQELLGRTSVHTAALPVNIKIINTDIIGPNLGIHAYESIIVCGIASMLLIFTVMIWIYKIPGLVACIALIIYTLITLYSMVLLNAKLTLHGLAGLVLSIGMSVDANVVIYERIIEEIKSGKSIRTSIDKGFSIAMGTIIDSNVTTIIAGFVFFYFGIGSIKGFGITLMLGITASMLTAVFFSKYLLKLLSNIFTDMDIRAYGVKLR